jgi:hypothetical protein
MLILAFLATRKNGEKAFVDLGAHLNSILKRVKCVSLVEMPCKIVNGRG